MIDERIAKSLFGPFRGYPGEPSDESGLRSRYACLAGRSRSESHARRVMSDLLERLEYFPKVSDIVRACEYTPDDAVIVSRRNECAYCHGDGFRTVEGPYGTSAAYPCDHTGHVNPRMGVPLSAAAQRHYQSEQEPAALRMEAWLARPQKAPLPKYPPVPQQRVVRDLQRVSAEDVERALALRHEAERIEREQYEAEEEESIADDDD